MPDRTSRPQMLWAGLSLDGIQAIWSCEGQINTCVFPTSHPGYALCSYVLHYVVMYWLEHLAKLEEKLSQHDIAGYTAKRHQSVYWQASISVNWAVVVFARFLHAF